MPGAATATKLPTELWGLQRRPYVVSFTGDSTGFLGGSTGDESLTPSDLKGRGRKGFGRLTWTTWNSTQGRAWGVVWLNDCKPACAGGTFHPKKANVHVYRPNRSGIFTRMHIDAGKYTDTRGAVRFHGYWVWSPLPFL